MKIYLVGGAVRDHVMGLPVSDRDYVVVGSTVEEMLSLGYKQVGANFPVFLHPETGEEYALARQERKTGCGYLGFEAIFDENTTLEDDLRRRDLTMNAMAMDLETGDIIDPFNGRNDIKDKILRHTSEAFAEDPVRVLRLARFAAKYDFMIDPDTADLCFRLGQNGELSSITSERLFKELEKTLNGPNPEKFFSSLYYMEVLENLFLEIENLRFVPAGPNQYHAEGSTLIHTLMVVKESARHKDPIIKFGALVHDFGKAVTPKEKLPSHPGHEEAGVSIVNAFCDRLKMPNDYRRVGVLCARHHGHVHKTFEMSAKSFVKIYKDFNKGHFLHDIDILVKVAEADHYGRISVDNGRDKGYKEAEVFKKVLTAVHNYRISQEIPVDELKLMRSDIVQQKAHMGRCKVARHILKEWKDEQASTSFSSDRPTL